MATYVDGYEFTKKFSRQSTVIRCHMMSRYHMNRALAFHLSGEAAKAEREWNEAKRLIVPVCRAVNQAAAA